MRAAKRGAPEVSSHAPILRAHGSAALDRALEAVSRSGEAGRFGAIGTSGSGKTTLLVELVKAWLRLSPGRALIMDASAEKRFDHVLPPHLVCVRESPAHLAKDDPPRGTRVIVYRPLIFQGARVDCEAWAEVAWNCAGHHLQTLTVNDEVIPHLAEFCQFKGGPYSPTKRNFIEGRKHGISMAWGTVDLTDVPLAMVKGVLFVFQTDGQALEILRRRGFLKGVPDGLIENLPTYPRPPEERGEFLWLQSGVPWDRTIYKF